MAKWIEEENGDVWIPGSTAAKMLEVSIYQLSRLRSDGTLKHFRRIGGKRLFSPFALRGGSPRPRAETRATCDAS